MCVAIGPHTQDIGELAPQAPLRSATAECRRHYLIHTMVYAFSKRAGSVTVIMLPLIVKRRG